MIVLLSSVSTTIIRLKSICVSMLMCAVLKLLITVATLLFILANVQN